MNREFIIPIDESLQTNNRALGRREFLQRVATFGFSATSIALLNGCGIFPAPIPTPPKIPRIGFLSSNVSDISAASNASIREFLRGLNDLGYVEGKNITIEYRFAEGKDDRLPMLASELVSLKVDIIVVNGISPTRAATNATSTIPIVFFQPGDPVQNGFVVSLAHPGRNATGTASLGPNLSGKRLELLKNAFPGVSRVAVLWDSNTIASTRREIQDTGDALGLHSFNGWKSKCPKILRAHLHQ